MAIARSDLIDIADCRIGDAESLFKNKRFDGAYYLCGYAIEVILKARLCKHLKWNEFPEKSDEFKGKGNLKTHNLDVLLIYTGMERKIKKSYFTDWSIVQTWAPESRYSPPNATEQAALAMLTSTKKLVRVLRA